MMRAQSSGTTMKLMLRVSAALCAALLAVPALAQVNPEVDPSLKPYHVHSKHTGKFSVGSSESIKQLVDLWIKGFREHHPGIDIKNETIKTAEGGKAMIKGINPLPEGAQVAALSYRMDEAVQHEVTTREGVKPIKIPVALDAIVLVVHSKNPLPGLTLHQIGELFGTRDSGKIEKWDQVGLNGSMAGVHVNLYGRDATSGTYAAFQEMGLNGVEQRPDVHAQPGSMSVIIEVGNDPAGIGYAATGFAVRSSKVRIVPVAKTDKDRPILPTNETVASGAYPLTRHLYFYVLPDANGHLNAEVKDFMEFVLSYDGQKIAQGDGFFPLPAHVAEQAAKELEGHGHAGAMAEYRK
jgi:phosphate transport system substrate-binding protein